MSESGPEPGSGWTSFTARHLSRIPFGRMLRFGTVGATGVFVNQGLLMLLHGRLGWPLLISSAIAIETSILSNFALNSAWTWRYDYDGSIGRVFQKVIQYQIAALVTSFVGNVAVLAALVYLFSIDYRAANLLGIAAGMGMNFLAGELWVFRATGRRGDSEEGASTPDSPGPGGSREAPR